MGHIFKDSKRKLLHKLNIMARRIFHTLAKTFGVNSGSVIGKWLFSVTEGSGDYTLTVTNTALTANRTITFPNNTGTVALVPTPQTELTDELTTITFTAPSSADYALQDLTADGGYGFKTKDEGNSVLAVIANLQTRVNELETKLVALGFIADAD